LRCRFPLLSIPTRGNVLNIPIIKTSAVQEQGIDQLIDSLEKHHTFLVGSGLLIERWRGQIRSEVESLVLHTVMTTLQTAVSEEEWRTLVEDIVERRRELPEVGCELVERIRVKHEPMGREAKL
jgi:LAO/AO transport system kinase